MKNNRIAAMAAGFLCLFAAQTDRSWATAGFGAGQSLDVKEFLLEAKVSKAPDVPGIITEAGTLDVSKTRPAVTRYEKVQGFMRELSRKYPENVKLVAVGSSDSGAVIEGLKIGHGPVHRLVVAAHHGNEWVSTELAKAFAEAAAAAPLDGLTVYVIPVVNISGYNYINPQSPENPGNRYELAGDKYIDPNRDYEAPCGSAGPPFSLKSTRSVAKFIETENIVAAASLHSPFEMVVFPWAALRAHTADDAVFRDLARLAAIESGYPVGTLNEMIWYPIIGAFDDYAYWKFGIWSWTFELAVPSQTSSIGEILRKNLAGLTRLMVNAPVNRSSTHGSGPCRKPSAVPDLHLE